MALVSFRNDAKNAPESPRPNRPATAPNCFPTLLVHPESLQESERLGLATRGQLRLFAEALSRPRRAGKEPSRRSTARIRGQNRS